MYFLHRYIDLESRAHARSVVVDTALGDIAIAEDMLRKAGKIE